MMCLNLPPQRKMTSHDAGHMVLGQTIFELQRGNILNNLVDRLFVDIK